MKRLLLYVLISSIIMSGCYSNDSKSNPEQRIIFNYEFAPNYILHIYSIAGIGFSSDYSEKYKYTVKESDLKYLQQNKGLLVFNDGKAGSFSFLCFFLPSYLGLKSKEDFVKYYNSLIKALEKNNFNEFLELYKVDWNDRFLLDYREFFNLSNDVWEKSVKPLNPKFKRIADIFINNIDAYEKNVWTPVVKQVLIKRTKELNKSYESKGNFLIMKWEQLTGMRFIKDKYYITLCYSSENGPNANSLSYDKNVFYYNLDEKYFNDFICHEIGTHLFVNLFHFKIDNVDNSDIYAAAESLAMFYNKKVLGVDVLNYTLSQFNSENYQNIYSQNYKPGIAPEELLKKAFYN